MVAHPADAAARSRDDAAGANRRFVSVALSCLVVAVALAGCMSAPKPPPPPPPPVEVAWRINAAADLNPSVSSRPSPLRLRVYELRTGAAFTGADFMALYNADDAALARDLVAREEFVLQPGQTVERKRVLGAETQFVAVMAGYRDVEHATWRALAPVQPGKTRRIEVHADALAVSVMVSVSP
jgi:type VI secretion system protein VasD